MSVYMPFIECLPTETTGEIFKYLPLKDAAHCEQLCKLAQEIILKQDCPLTQAKDLIARIKMCDNLLNGRFLLHWVKVEGRILSNMFVASTAVYPINLLLQQIPYVNLLYTPFEAIGIDSLYNSPYLPIAISLGAVCALTAAKTAELFLKKHCTLEKIFEERHSLNNKLANLKENDARVFNNQETNFLHWISHLSRKYKNEFQ